jgi:hypothetical protein
MNDHPTKEEDDLGGRVLIILLLVYTSPFWGGYLLHLFDIKI